MPLPTSHLPPSPGPDDFLLLRERGHYFVDKTGFIAEWLASPDQVVLIPRPRRFGKTVNLSMLRYWLDSSEADRAWLFEGLEISEASPEIQAHRGRYPVISVSFKDVKDMDFDAAVGRIRDLIGRMVLDHLYLLQSPHLDGASRVLFEAYRHGTADKAQLQSSLRWLSDWLRAHHGRNVVILIDEYDAPIETGFQHGYYDQIVSFMRGMLGTALKTNPSLYRAVLTGVRQVSKESLFSDVNNVLIRSMWDPDYSTRFGFTEAEVVGVLAAAGRSDALADVRAWYNGYVFGGQVIYNPWSVLCYARAGELRDFWVQTSADALLRRLLTRGDGLDGDFETLISGGTVEKVIDAQVALRDLDSQGGRIWSVLLTAGYLKANRVWTVDGQATAELAIPNVEVSHVWRRCFTDWLVLGLGDRSAQVEQLQRAILIGDAETVENLLGKLVANVLSSHDLGGPDEDAERVYHAFVLGLLCTLEADYRVRSNRESGSGRADVLILPRAPGRPGVVLEFKKINRRRRETAKMALTAAHQQIEEKGYRAELVSAGASPIHALAIAFDGKKVWVR